VYLRSLCGDKSVYELRTGRVRNVHVQIAKHFSNQLGLGSFAYARWTLNLAKDFSLSVSSIRTGAVHCWHCYSPTYTIKRWERNDPLLRVAMSHLKDSNRMANPTSMTTSTKRKLPPTLKSQNRHWYGRCVVDMSASY